MGSVDVVSAVVSGGTGIIGAAIGAFTVHFAERETRESDRRKRCVDRVLAAITELEKSYMAYAVAAATGSDGPHQALHLQGALRGYNQAIQMLHIKSLRNEAERYGNQLIEYYLVYGQPRDPLDADRDVPTVHELNTAHTYLSDKLRRYEKT